MAARTRLGLILNPRGVAVAAEVAAKETLAQRNWEMKLISDLRFASDT
jgi:hypothetical protein